MIFLSLFWAFFQIGLFSIGGGYAAMPLIQNQVVQIFGWLTMDEFADVVTISQMTPGPIAINAATFVGIKVAGIAGAVITTVGCVLPSCVIVILFAVMYRKYANLHMVQGVLHCLQPAVVGLIASAGVSIIAHALWNGTLLSFSLADFNLVALLLIAASFLALRAFKASPIAVMLGAGAVGGLVYSLFQ